MIVLKVAMLVSLGLATLGMFGCDLVYNDRSHPAPAYVQQEPVYVEQQPQYIVVQQAPPPVRIESRPARPAGSFVWVDGYWNWDNQRYTWQAGRYVAPPQPDVIWIAPRYESDVHGGRYIPGQWSKQNPGNGRGRGHDN